ncbi:MAG: triose-phosphate isomerase [Coriobacteriales bacterium]|nr:triose-phosphate isomerase [Coriobacteriales bacterium]
MRKPIVAGNWTMKKPTVEAVDFSQQISYDLEKFTSKVEVILCPPYTDLKSVFNVLIFDKSFIKVGAQDVYPKDFGAYTGCINGDMIKEIGCEYCIIGHSERREYFKETDEFINEKAKYLIEKKIIPIICCGESLEVRQEGNYIDFVCSQVEAALSGIDADEVAKLVIAYEPIWAIGTGLSASPQEAQEVCKAIRDKIALLYSTDIAQQTRILYGGSMNVGNVENLAPQPDIDGGLIGGAALKSADFAKLAEAFYV